jgi:hypothetical protein
VVCAIVHIPRNLCWCNQCCQLLAKIFGQINLKDPLGKNRPLRKYIHRATLSGFFFKDSQCKMVKKYTVEFVNGKLTISAKNNNQKKFDPILINVPKIRPPIFPAPHNLFRPLLCLCGRNFSPFATLGAMFFCYGSRAKGGRNILIHSFTLSKFSGSDPTNFKDVSLSQMPIHSLDTLGLI